MAIGGLIIAGAAMAGQGYMSYKASEKQEEAARRAAKVQMQAERDAARERYAAQERVKAGLSPFLTPEQRAAWDLDPVAGSTGAAGFQPTQSALDQYRAATGVYGEDAQRQFFQTFQEDPGTQFLRDQGLRALENQAAASGNFGGGSRLKAMTEFSQNLANQQYQQRLGQLANLAQSDLSLASTFANQAVTQGDIPAQAALNLGGIQGQQFIDVGNIGAQQLQNLGQTIGNIGGLVGGAVSGGMFGGGGPKVGVSDFPATTQYGGGGITQGYPNIYQMGQQSSRSTTGYGN